MIEHSEALDELVPDLAIAHKEMPHADDSGFNPHFKNKFANLQMLQQRTLPHLAKHGLAIIQGSGSDRETHEVTMTTMLLHKSGQWIKGTMSAKPDREGAQAKAATATYLQRMGLRQMAQVIVGGETEEAYPDLVDDDAESATDHTLDPEVAKALAYCRSEKMPDPMIDAFWVENGELPRQELLAALKSTLRNFRQTSKIPVLTKPQAKAKSAKVTNDDDALFF
jgi:hypothetical protein